MADTKISSINGGTISVPTADSVLPFVESVSTTPTNQIASPYGVAYEGINMATAMTAVDFLSDYLGLIDTSGTILGKVLAKYIRGTTNEVSITAAGGWPSTTQPCLSAALYETSTNKQNFMSMGFNDGTVTYAEVQFTMPYDYDGGNLVINQIEYYGSSAQASAVVWGVQAACIQSGSALDQAWGGAGTITDTYLGTAYLYKYSTGAATITPSGAASGRNLMRFRIFRNGTIAADTYAGTAYFSSMQMIYTRGSI